MTKLNPTLPKDFDANGLDSINSILVKDPEAAHILLCVVDCKQVVIDTDTGHEEATVRVLRVEPVTDANRAAADRMLTSAFQERTGKKTLPFDPDTGEILGDH